MFLKGVSPAGLARELLNYLAFVNLRSGRTAVNLGDSSLTVTFSSVLPSMNYSLIATWQNTTDVTPQFQPIEITAFDTGSFTLKWNVPVDTAHYSINWQVLPFN